MRETSRSATSQQDRSPAAVAMVAILLIAASFVVTPNWLITLGPMKHSLTSAKPFVRKTAMLEVTTIRVLSFAIGVVLSLIAIRWKSVVGSSIVRSIDRHPAAPRRTREVLNLSLVVMACAIVAGLLYVFYSPRVLPDSLRRAINREDGGVEQATAVLFLLSSLLSFLVAYRSRLSSRRIAHLLLGVGLLFCVGEEISWGQRLMGFKTPEAFQEVNVQDEFNLHNLFGYAADHVFIAGILVFGVLLPIMAYAYPWFGKLFRGLGLPMASLGLVIGFFLASLWHDWIIHPPSTHVGLRVAEFRELFSALGLLLLMTETLQLAKSDGENGQVEGKARSLGHPFRKVPGSCKDAAPTP